MKKLKLHKKIRKVETVETCECSCTNRCQLTGSAYAREYMEGGVDLGNVPPR